MKSKRRVALVLVAVAAAVGAVAWYRSQPKSIPSQAWRHFAPPGCGCELDVPGEPIGNALWVKSDGREYVAAYTWIPWGHDFGHGFQYHRFTESASTPDLFEREYAREVREIADRWRATVFQETDVQLGPHTGREFHARGPNRDLWIVQVYIVKTRAKHEVYILEASGEGARPSHRDFTRYFRSFKIDQ